MELTVLVVAHNFPPVGGAATQRALGFLRHLPRLGFRTIVLTGPGNATDFWSPRDEALTAEIPRGLEVVRVRGPEPHAPEGARRRVGRLLARPTPFRRWFAGAALEAVRSQLAARPDVILGELVPYDVSEAVVGLSRELARPWVADLHDPWAFDEMWLYPTGWHRHVDTRRMARVLATASAVVMNTEEAAKRVRSGLDIGEVPVFAIPSGFGAEHFVGPPATKDPATFRIVHTGTMHLASGLDHRRKRRWRAVTRGMPFPGVDFVSRSHYYLVTAVEHLLDARPALAEELEFLLVGPTTSADDELSDRFPFVRRLGFQTYSETIALIRSADLLFLPMHEMPGGARAGLVPTKTYEYLASGRPILAAVPGGDARDLLKSTRGARVCDPSDVGAMTDALRSSIEAWRAGEVPVLVDEQAVARFEYGRLAEQLAVVLRGAVGDTGRGTARR